MYKNLNNNGNSSLADLLSKYYNKKVEIRVIRLRYLHQSSDILAEHLAMRLAQRGSNPLRTLRTALQGVRIPKINSLDRSKQGSSLTNLREDLTVENYKKGFANEEELRNAVLMSIRYKVIAGLRVKIAGRLNRRAIAARSVTKTGQVGSLKNYKSSFEGQSAVLLRGHERPNMVKSSFNFKTRNGAFNVKV